MKEASLAKPELKLIDGESEAFAPTEDMKKARVAVRALVDEGKLTPPDWQVFFRNEARAGRKPAMDSDRWREWQEIEGFDGWFYSGLFPAPSKHALRALSEQWLVGLMAAMAKGDFRALKWYHDEVLEKDKAGDDGAELVRRLQENKGTTPWGKKGE